MMLKNQVVDKTSNIKSYVKYHILSQIKKNNPYINFFFVWGFYTYKEMWHRNQIFGSYEFIFRDTELSTCLLIPSYSCCPES